MSTVLRHVLLLQRDVPAAAKFYQEGLGLVVNVCTERWAELSDGRPPPAISGSASGAGGDSPASRSPSAPGPTVIALKAVEGEAQRTTGYSPILSFTVGDMDATVNNLLRLGATLDGPIKYPVQGKVAAVRAPDGHMLGLFEPAEGA